MGYEGLMVTNQDNVPQTYADMDNPEFEMGSYDGDITSFRAILPYQYVSVGSISDITGHSQVTRIRRCHISHTCGMSLGLRDPKQLRCLFRVKPVFVVQNL